MAIKKIVFKGLSCTSVQYTAIGGIRFYDTNGNVIPSGSVIANTSTSAETTNFIMTATSTSTASYSVLYAFDTSINRSTMTYPNNYWLTNSDNQVLTVEFKINVGGISKIEFVPKPDTTYTDRAIDRPFTIEVYDENLVLIKIYNITPTATSRNEIQTLNTPELAYVNKILILSSDGEVESLGGGNEYEFSPSNMTSNMSPSPYNVTTSSVYSTYQGWQSFDGVEPLVNTANGWIANGTTGTITLDLGVGNEQVLTRYEFYPYYPDPTRSPKDWKIQGSNDNVTWIDIDTQVGITGWTAGVKKSFNITSGVKDKFRYFRVNVTANNGGTYLAIGEINFFSLTSKYIKSIPSQTEQDFINHGMDLLSSIDPKSNFTKKQYIQSQSAVLGSGKTFTQPIDLTRYKVNKISFQ